MATIQTLLMRCPRSALEALIRQSQEEQTPVSLQMIEAHLSDDMRGAEAPEKKKLRVVNTGELRSGTGHFDAQTHEQHLKIFLQLSLRDRLTIAIGVCKSWRSLRTEVSMWKDLRGFEGHPPFMNGAGFVRLLSWLPKNCAETLDLRFNTIDASSICKGLRELRGWKGALSAKQQALPTSHVRRLCFAGKRIGATVTKTIATMYAGVNLTDLDVSKDGKGVRDSDILSIFKQSPNLERLKLSRFSRGLLEGLLSCSKEVRQGGSPIITELSVDAGWSVPNPVYQADWLNNWGD
jgi:hypothetical protein